MTRKLAIAACVLIFSLMITITPVFAADSIFSIAANVIEEATGQCDLSDGHWEPVGDCRITEYCPFCNSPQGHGSASGAYLEYGHVACGWLPIGAVIKIDGEIFTVVDVCGTDAIDIFVPCEDYCQCDMNEYKYVEIWVD